MQIGGVTGEVIDIGLVRLHLMELSGTEYIPTGRVVAFSNTIVFQPTSGLFKQIPGTNFLVGTKSLSGYLWRPNTTRLRNVCSELYNTVLADYEEELERQDRAMRSSFLSTPASGRLQPKAQVRFTTSDA